MLAIAVSRPLSVRAIILLALWARALALGLVDTFLKEISMRGKQYRAIKPIILKFLAQGGKAGEAARFFGLNRSTVYAWALQRPDHAEVVKRNCGHKPKNQTVIGAEKLAELLRRDATGDVSRSVLAREYGISRETLYKYIRAHRANLVA